MVSYLSQQFLKAAIYQCLTHCISKQPFELFLFGLILLSAGGTLTNLLAEIFYSYAHKDRKAFLSLSLSPIPHSFSRDFSAAVQLWNFSRFSNSYPALICDSTKLWFLLHLFGIQTTFDVSLPVHPPNFTWEAA